MWFSYVFWGLLLANIGLIIAIAVRTKKKRKAEGLEDDDDE